MIVPGAFFFDYRRRRSSFAEGENMIAELLSVGEAAAVLSDELGQPVKPRWISTLAYDRELRADYCPMIGGRRLIERSYLPEVARALRRRGWLGRAEGGGA
jgi:hypothetical protein